MPEILAILLRDGVLPTAKEVLAAAIIGARAAAWEELFTSNTTTISLSDAIEAAARVRDERRTSSEAIS